MSFDKAIECVKQGFHETGDPEMRRVFSVLLALRKLPRGKRDHLAVMLRKCACDALLQKDDTMFEATETLADLVSL